MTRLRLLLVVLLACGFVASGCGDDDTNTEEESDAPATVETAPEPPVETTETAPPPGDEGDAGALEGDQPLGEQAVEACKAAIGEVSGEIRDDLETICEQVRDGDRDDVREASIEICKTLVRDSVPAGATREQALETCERAGQ